MAPPTTPLPDPDSISLDGEWTVDDQLGYLRVLMYLNEQLSRCRAATQSTSP